MAVKNDCSNLEYDGYIVYGAKGEVKVLHRCEAGVWDDTGGFGGCPEDCEYYKKREIR